MYRYHALGGASLLVLGSALSLDAVGRRGPDGAAGGDRRGAARNGREASSPQAGRPFVRPDARRGRLRPTPRHRPSLTAGITPERGARAALSGAHWPDRDHHRSQPVRQPAGVLGGGRAAREPRHLDQAGQRAARYRHLDSRFQCPEWLRHPQPRDLRRRLSGHPAGRTFPQRPDRSASAYGAIDVIRGPSSALYGNYATGGALNFRTRPGGTHRRRRIRRRRRQLRLSQQLSRRRQEGRQFRGLAVCERCAG